MINFSAFVDEMVKIKEAAFLQNVAAPFMRTDKSVLGNLANTARGFARPVEGVRQGVSSMLTGKGFAPKANIALTVAGGGLMLPNVVKKEDPSGHNASRVARGAGFVGGQVGGLIGTPFGLSGGIAGGVAGEAMGRGVGRVIDKARGIKRTKSKAPVPLRTPMTGINTPAAT